MSSSDISEVRSGIFSLSQKTEDNPSKFKSLGFAIVIIFGIGGLAAAGVGVGGLLQVGSLSNPGQMINSIVMIVIGGGGGIPLIIIGIVGFCNTRSSKQDLEATRKREEQEKRNKAEEEKKAKEKEIARQQAELEAKKVEEEKKVRELEATKLQEAQEKIKKAEVGKKEEQETTPRNKAKEEKKVEIKTNSTSQQLQDDEIEEEKTFTQKLQYFDTYNKNIQEIADNLSKITPINIQPQEIINIIFENGRTNKIIPLLDAVLINYPSFILSSYDKIRRTIVEDEQHLLTNSSLIAMLKENGLDNDEEKIVACYDLFIG